MKNDLQHILDHAAHYLPQQGPIGVFIHHNTLHAFQHLPFEEAVVKAGEIFGTEPFLTEEAYQQEFEKGRITTADIEIVLSRESDTAIWPSLTRRMIRRAMLMPGLRPLHAANLAWQIDECGLLDHLRNDIPLAAQNTLLNGNDERTATRALWAACTRRVPAAQQQPAARPARLREAILSLCDEDIDEIIHPWLIRLCAVYLDQGQAHWPMPWRKKGFYAAVRRLLQQPFMLEPGLLRGTRAAFAQQGQSTAEQIVLDFLTKACAHSDEWEQTIIAELLALPGWAGLMRRLEEEPALAHHVKLPAKLIDFLAVRLTLTQVVVENLRRQGRLGKHQESSYWAMLQTPIATDTNPELEQLAAVAQLFDVAQLLGLSAGQLDSLSAVEFKRLDDEIQAFHELERRRIWHLAYEYRHEQLNLAPLQLHRATVNPKRTAHRYAAQVITCIDEREESFRRALEELAPDVETLGAAGFFGVAVHYEGLDDAHAVDLCPIVVKPQHLVHEKPIKQDRTKNERRQKVRQRIADIAHNNFLGSRMLVRGWLGTMGLGLFSLFPLITRVLAPARYGQLMRWLNERFLPDLRTELSFMRESDEPVHGLMQGFSIAEKADRVAGVLATMGLVENLSRLVVVLGHGSTSLNNPHESAHDCGACGGRRGGPNARLFAAMANHPEVRTAMRERGVNIPADTWFVGGYHDTCSDDVDLYDTHAIPASLAAEFARIRQQLNDARAANALERARRFEAAWEARTPAQGLWHVHDRSQQLAEPRPEYGHCTNAVAIVGRRATTRGLFLDRRAFLISYDPDTDQAGDRLAAGLGAAGPVCAGINLEYYFSFVDNERYGCGTKLPHNVTGLVGVMNGHASDLRTGLPWQMVEVHEPVRLLLIIEATQERVLYAASKSPVVTELVNNRWIRVVTMHPETGALHVLRDGAFEPFVGELNKLPTVPSSVAWYHGKLEHLPIVRVAA